MPNTYDEPGFTYDQIGSTYDLWQILAAVCVDVEMAAESWAAQAGVGNWAAMIGACQ